MAVSTTRQSWSAAKYMASRSPAVAIAEFISAAGSNLKGADPRSTHINATLGRAVLRLLEYDPQASELFSSIIDKHDVREAWLGLAIAHHFQGERTLAGAALGHALSLSRPLHRPNDREFDRAIDAGTGMVCAELQGHADNPVGADAQGRSLPQRALTTNLCPSLPMPAAEFSLLGCPAAGVVVETAAFTSTALIYLEVQSTLKVLRESKASWIVITAICTVGHGAQTIQITNQRCRLFRKKSGRSFTVAAAGPIDIATTSALARPRAFRIDESELRQFDGPLHVYGADGRELTGSPLDPSAERLGAEAVSKIVASRFFDPESKPVTAPRGFAFLSVAAHVIGGPIAAGSRKRPVDVVIPVYGALDRTLACLESVLTDLPPWARIIVIDDASPDPLVGQALRRLATAGRITLFTNAVNQGFPRTANIGIRQDPERDIVLLNSDTLVPPGCLASLRQAAYLARDIGSATPISNDATILSYPSRDHPNAIPDLNETICLDALAKRANFGSVVDIPTAVGFCVYIKRDCLNATGLLREDLFAQGYGEENDFSIRARHLGWRHVAVPSIFVAHVGGQSFGSAKHHLIERNMRKLNQLHPGYDALIHEFQRADPLAEPRRRLDWPAGRHFAPKRAPSC